ncbi:Endoplasmic reticulum metallopeptidase 1 [Galdieria sulphuraria]|nr:Endoplasmic reticulum metallopeptidase 1 [Galdieria sulphuraria]
MKQRERWRSGSPVTKNSTLDRRVSSKGASDQKRRLSNSSYSTSRADLSYPWFSVATFSLFAFLVYSLGYWGWSHEPAIVKATSPNSEFSAERAFATVQVLADEIGFRVVGTKGLESAQEYTLQQLELLSREARRRGFSLEVEVQKVSGNYDVKLPALGEVTISTSYTNIKNIVARLSGPACERWIDNHSCSMTDNNFLAENANCTQPLSLLVNSHLDSAVGSPGASDAAAPCGVILELINNLIHMQPAHLRRPIVFLLNGAEETLLDGAHGFLTKHRWSRNVGALVNLESSGSGGLELLFRCGPRNAWLAKAYAKSVKYPHASAVAQDIFERELVPAETDFRVFWELGGIPGVDLANYVNGQTYHTSRDAVDRVTSGFLQHMGSNALEIIKELVGPHDALGKSKTSDSYLWNKRAMYYDFLGLTTFFYLYDYAKIFHYSLSILALFYVIYILPRRGCSLGLVFRAFCSLLLGLVASVCVAILVGLFLHFIWRKPLMWYSEKSLVFPLFCASAAFVFLTGFELFLSRRYQWNITPVRYKANRWYWLIPKVNDFATFTAEIILGSFILFQMTVLIVTTYFELGFSFMPFWNLVFAVVVGVMGLDEESSWLFRCCLLVIPCGIFSFPNSLIGLSAFMPIMGRSGPWLLTDVIIGAMSSSFFILVSLPVVVFLTKYRNAYRMFRFIMLVTFLIVIQHLVTCDSNEKSSGIFMSAVDIRDLKTEKNLLHRVLSSTDIPPLASHFHWGLLESGPWENLQPISWFFSGYEISRPVASHSIPCPQLEIVRKVPLANGTGNLVELLASFPSSHWGSLRLNASLVSWSLSESVPKPFSDGTRFLRHIGSYEETSFRIVLNTSTNEPFAVDMTSTYFGASPETLDIIQRLPDWTDAVTFQTSGISFLIG